MLAAELELELEAADAVELELELEPQAWSASRRDPGRAAGQRRPPRDLMPLGFLGLTVGVLALLGVLVPLETLDGVVDDVVMLI